MVGYAPFPAPIPSNPGDIDGTGSDTNFTNVYSAGNVYTNLWGIGNKVLIADAADFGPGDEVALRQVVGFADDAPNALQGTTCGWTLHFVAETE